MPLRQEELDALWDFDDAMASEHRFRDAALAEPDLGRRAELLTQVARALGLQDRFAEADAQLDELGQPDAVGRPGAAGPSGDVGPSGAIGQPGDVGSLDPVLRTRVALERGRLRNSGGDPTAAMPLFEEAAALSTQAGLRFLRVDALHMLAIASGTDVAAAEAWTERALALLVGEPDARTRRWAVSLRNNLGWTRFDAGDLDGAMGEFQAALDAALRDGTQQQVTWANEAIAECEAAARTLDRG